MFRSLLCISALLLVAFNGMAQLKEDDPRFEKHYKAVDPIETDEVRIEVIRPHSQESFTQIAFKIFNKTDDYILVKKHAVSFKSDENGYGVKHPKEDIDFIEPHGDITRSFKAAGGIGFKVNELEVSFDGVFSRAPVDGKLTEGGEFKMKPDKNSMMMGPFAVTLKKWRFSPKELSADFKIRYRGEALGIVDERAVTIRKEDGTILENTEQDHRAFIIPPMATRTVNVVRPFAKDAVGKGESVYVVWDQALRECPSTEFEVPGFSTSFDEAKTKEENK